MNHIKSIYVDRFFLTQLNLPKNREGLVGECLIQKPTQEN